MADSDSHRSVLAYVVGAALGGVALALTAWVGLRRRHDDRPADAQHETDVPDEDLV